MQNPNIRPKKIIDIETNCVKAVNTYVQVKAESNNFIKLVHLFLMFCKLRNLFHYIKTYL